MVPVAVLVAVVAAVIDERSNKVKPISSDGRNFPRIPEEHLSLWRQLQEFEFDVSGVPEPFSLRLARKMEWHHNYTLRVIDEYRKFLYLLKTAGHMVTPSKAVDEVWHLHLIYTHSYWEVLCVGIFKEAVHHHPGDGSTADMEKYAAIYERTLDDYSAVFGEPPVEVWGHRNKGINWRNVLARFPMGRRARTQLLELFPQPGDEAL